MNIPAEFVLDIDIQCITRTVACNLRRCHSKDGSVLDVCRQGIDFLDNGVHILSFMGTLIPVTEFQDDIARSGRLTGNHTISRHTTLFFHFGNGGKSLLYLAHNLIGGRQRTSRRGVDIDHDRTEVLLRDK